MPAKSAGKRADVTLIAEFKRRKVSTVGGARLLKAMLGFPIALLLAWMFDMTPEGVKAQRPARGTHSDPRFGSHSKPL